jgi:hypothetical protein
MNAGALTAGHGCLVDYTNPDAVQWWHKQMDPVLDLVSKQTHDTERGFRLRRLPADRYPAPPAPARRAAGH